MDKVDKLIIRAKRTAQRKAERFYMGFVNYDPDTGKWVEHGTTEAAVDALQALADEYPNTVEDAVIFIDDLTE